MLKNKKKNIVGAILLMLILGIGLYLILRQSSAPIEINKSSETQLSMANEDAGQPKSPISGLACADANRRPIAVMLGEDPAARPLTGLADADLVVEMEVVKGSITRMMSVFVCGNPGEIGAIRSARHDYISLAMGLDAIYAHWGGSHFALDKLNKGIMDNIDALTNPYNSYYRKSNIIAPYNGFSSITRLTSVAKNLGYRLQNQFSGYPHLATSQTSSHLAKTLNIGYAGIYAVKYDYDPASNSYLRWRGGAKEIEKSTKQQVAAKNVVIMRAASRILEDQYNDVDVEGEGKCAVYRNGEEISGTWKKDAKDRTSKLYFYDNKGQEIKFVPGQIWIEIVDPGVSITY